MEVLRMAQMKILVSAKFLTCASCTLLALTLLRSPLAAQVSNDPAAPPPAVVPVEPGPNPPVTSPAEPERVLLPAGTVISVRIADRVDSSHLHSGDLLTGIVDPSLIYEDRVLIPRGIE